MLVKSDEIHKKPVLLFDFEVRLGARFKDVVCLFLHLYHETHFAEVKLPNQSDEGLTFKTRALGPVQLHGAGRPQVGEVTLLSI